MAKRETLPEPTVVQADVMRGTCTIRYWGNLRNKDQIIYEERREGVTPDQIATPFADMNIGWYLPKSAKRRSGWSYYKVECFWQYPGMPEHRQWSLTID